MIQKKLVRYSLALFLLTVTPVAVFAQSSRGAIAGDITDNNGGALPGVSVTAANIATNASRTVTTRSRCCRRALTASLRSFRAFSPSRVSPMSMSGRP